MLRYGRTDVRTPPLPAPTAGARPAAWRSCRTGRRSRRTGTPAVRRRPRRSARHRSAHAGRRPRSPARSRAPARPTSPPRGRATRPRPPTAGWRTARRLCGQLDGAVDVLGRTGPGTQPERVGAEVAADLAGLDALVLVHCQQAVAAAATSAPASSVTGARSRYTSSSTSGSASSGTPAGPTTSHSDVTPCSRSASTAWRVDAGSGCACRWRTSQPGDAPSGRPPRVNGGSPGKPASGAVSSAV